jgi:starch synthase
MLRERNSSLRGILNGVDYEEWNPARDPHIRATYSTEDLGGKLLDKLDLREG